MLTQSDTEVIDLYLDGARLATIETEVASSTDHGAQAAVGGMWVPYRPKLSSGGVTGTAHISHWVAQCAGLV